jgi:hypothetical protein
MSWRLNTAACLCIVFYKAVLIFAVEFSPFEYLSLSKFAIVYSPAFEGKSFYNYPGIFNSFIVWAALLPKITKSKREFAPSLFAPCTDAQAASPQANKPGINTSSPYLLIVNT